MSRINLRLNKVELQDSLLLAADKTTEETFYDFEPQYSQVLQMDQSGTAETQSQILVS